jgi:hypothetical protein
MRVRIKSRQHRPVLIVWNDGHTSIRPRRGDFQSSLGRWRECHCYFFGSMARA